MQLSTETLSLCPPKFLGPHPHQSAYPLSLTPARPQGCLLGKVSSHPADLKVWGWLSFLHTPHLSSLLLQISNLPEVHSSRLRHNLHFLLLPSMITTLSLSSDLSLLSFFYHSPLFSMNSQPLNTWPFKSSGSNLSEVFSLLLSHPLPAVISLPTS